MLSLFIPADIFKKNKIGYKNVELEASVSPSPSLLPVNQNWQVYINKQLGLVFEYPSGTKLQESNPTYLPVNIMVLNNEDKTIFSTQITKIFSIENIKADKVNYTYKGQLKNNGLIVEKYIQPGFEFAPMTTYVVKSGEYYLILTKEDNSLDEESIFKTLSTFKSTNSQ